MIFINRLNPCFNGRYSQSMQRNGRAVRLQKVLILVLMEDTLRVTKEELDILKEKVLILVLMEDTLRDIILF